jgi:peptide/nickel transport system substrate-binding protein
MKKHPVPILVILIIATLVIAACAPQAAPSAEAPSVTEAITTVIATVQAPAELVTTTPPAAEGPTAGGTLHYWFGSEPATLDPQKAFMSVEDIVLGLLGGSLVIYGPGGQIYPYLAESWSTSADGLTWTFKVRQDVTFSDGTPLTAHDFAYTYQRALNPETTSPATGPMLGPVASVEAMDDYTLVFTLSSPYYPFLFSLSDPGYMQPMLQSHVESLSPDELARSPLGVGPYVLKEWLTSDRIIIERRADYNWGPSFVTNRGAFYIQTIEFPIITEYSTALAGLEAGELDIVTVQNKDVASFRDNDQYQIVDYLHAGISPFLGLNVSKPPFDNLKVRQAFNLAVDRQALIDIMLQGNGKIQYGPLSETVVGYWPGVEQIGYGFDLERAKQLMQEAGYTYTADGKLLTPDGQPFTLTMPTSTDEETTRLTQLLQQQYVNLGVDIQLETLDVGVANQKILSGDYTITAAGWDYPEADLMWLIFHSSMIGALNLSQLNSPELDAILDRTRTETDPTLRQDAVNEAQKWIVENAIYVPLYTSINHLVVNSRVKNYLYDPVFGSFYFNDAYIQP